MIDSSCVVVVVVGSAGLFGWFGLLVVDSCSFASPPN